MATAQSYSFPGLGGYSTLWKTTLVKSPSLKARKATSRYELLLKPRLANPPERVTSKGGKRRIKEALHLPPP
jgi:hypothetical protein